ncbi:hypothetical protein G9A89_000512, partial [Geosiphon pyriformis]
NKIFGSTLIGLQFSDTHTFICNRELLFKKLESNLENKFQNFYFVDVNNNKPTYREIDKSQNETEKAEVRRRKKPELLSKPPKEFSVFLNSKLLPFLFKTSELNSNTKDDDDDDDLVFYFELTPMCMVSITGWLLEYPVIYVQDIYVQENNLGDESVSITGNCLGNEPLKICKLYLKNVSEKKKT